MAEQPNDASRKSKAEGDRLSERDNNSAGDERGGYQNTDEQAAGISNRPLDEEVADQQSLPSRGESKPGAHAGHGDSDLDDRRSER